MSFIGVSLRFDFIDQRQIPLVAGGSNRREIGAILFSLTAWTYSIAPRRHSRKATSLTDDVIPLTEVWILRRQAYETCLHAPRM